MSLCVCSGIISPAAAHRVLTGERLSRAGVPVQRCCCCPEFLRVSVCQQEARGCRSSWGGGFGSNPSGRGDTCCLGVGW